MGIIDRFRRVFNREAGYSYPESGYQQEKLDAEEKKRQIEEMWKGRESGGDFGVELADARGGKGKELVNNCPFCGKDLQINEGGYPFCEDHGIFGMGRCPLCNTLSRFIINTPSVHQCGNASCENHIGLFATVNNKGFSYARRVFYGDPAVYSLDEGKRKGIAREILKGKRTETLRGHKKIEDFLGHEKIEDFGGIEKKRYFDDHDVDIIFKIWELGEQDSVVKMGNTLPVKVKHGKVKVADKHIVPDVIRKVESESDTGRDAGPEGVAGEKLCPTCLSFSHVPYPLHKLPVRGPKGSDLYQCNRCKNKFVEHNGTLHLTHQWDLHTIPGFLCPVVKSDGKPCGGKLYHDRHETPQGGTIYRIQCKNPKCKGGYHLQPWFVDLPKRDYEQWKKIKQDKNAESFEDFEEYMANNFDYDSDAKWNPIRKQNFQRLMFWNSSKRKEAGEYLKTRRLDLKRKKEFERLKKENEKLGYVKNMDLEGILGFSRDDDPVKYDAALQELAKLGIDPNEYDRLSKEIKDEIDAVDTPLTEELSKKRSKEAWERGDKYGKGWTGVGRFGNRLVKYSQQSTASIIMLLAGIVLGAMLSWPFTVALTAWAARNILPTPGALVIQNDFEKRRMGSLFAKSGKDDKEDYNNRMNTGLAATRSILKIVILFFLGYGFFMTDLPFRGFLLLVFFFTAYFSLPGEYSPDEPYKFMEGIWRPFVAFILAFVVFGGIFQSNELQWLCMAFFAVIPIAKERENLARAIGQWSSGVAATYENVDKVIFIILMFIGGGTVMNWFGMGATGLDLDWGTVAGNIFLPFWIISFIGGLTSPANVRPYTGIVMLTIVFVFFSAGPGEQIVGQGFFGVWWPSIHNTMTSVMTPIGEGMGALTNTFGQTFMLMTNPVGYAQNIMEGTYEKNPTGLTGAYGVEIEQLMLPAINPGTDAIATFNLRNVGPVDATNVEVTISIDDEQLSQVIELEPSTFSKDDYIDLASMEPSFIMPLYFTIGAENCESINEKAKEKYWLLGEKGEEVVKSGLSLRNMYIEVDATVDYDYNVNSWMPLEIISEQEWRDRTARGTFTQSNVGSHISTSPARLSIGSFDQPIVSGNRPFYVGLNLTSAEGPDSEIVWENPLTEVTLSLPNDIGNMITECMPNSGKYVRNIVGDMITYTWKGADIKDTAMYCMSSSITDMGVPSKTYYIRANSKFRFRKTVSKDTLFAFDDVCLE